MIDTAKSTEEVMVKMVLDSWNTYLARVDGIFTELSDDQLEKEIAPGRNRGIYILGHLTAVHDRMLPLLGFGEEQFPGLYEIFVTKPDREVEDVPQTPALRESWKNINQILGQHIQKVATNEWFERHTAVSEADFIKEPHRIKLNVMISRTIHLGNHLGQLVLLKPKKK
jgi:hypothetical protein